MRYTVLVLAVLGCRGADDPTRPVFTELALQVGTERAPLAQELVVEADRPVSLVVSWTDGDHEVEVGFPGVADTHAVPLLGFRPDRDYAVTVQLIDDEGRKRRREVALRTPPLPEWFPVLELRAHDPDRAEPGLTLLSTRLSGEWPSDVDLALVVDPEGHVVYWLDEGTHMMDARPSPQGLAVIAGRPSAELVRFDWLGRERSRFHSAAFDGGGVAVDAPGRFHHDWVPTDDGGGLVLSKEDRTVDYPTSYDDPDALSPQLVSQDVVLRFDGAGAVLWERSLGDLLDPSRIGFDALVPGRDDLGLDWSHANAVVPTDDGGVLLSLRNQDAVVKLTPEAAAVDWILGPSYGWEPPLSDLLLAPQGDLEPAYHQHGAKLSSDGSVVLFDNGNERASPGEVLEADLTPEEERYSRVVRFSVDEDARTVSLVEEHLEAEGIVQYADVVGDADLLPGGNLLGTFGAVARQDGIHNWDRGLAHRATRIVEWDAASRDEVWHLYAWMPLDESVNGWNTYRAERFADFYDLDTTEVERR